MLKHAKVSSAGTPADPAQVGGSDWNADHLIDADGATMTTRTDAPAAPAAGKMVMFGKAVGGGALPAFIGPSGISSPLQPFIGRNKVGVWTPYGNSATSSQLGVSLGTLGTLTTRTVATTNLFTSMRRLGLTTATTANARAQLGGVAQYFLSSQSGVGGFRFVARFGISDAQATPGAAVFAGLCALTTYIGNGFSPSAAANMIGVGADATDATLQMMSNDASGTATKIDLGANFPANTQNADFYELALFAASGVTGSVNWQVTNLSSGATASGTITTDLPAENQLLCALLVRSNLATGLAVGLDIAGVYIETDN